MSGHFGVDGPPCGEFHCPPYWTCPSGLPLHFRVARFFLFFFHAIDFFSGTFSRSREAIDVGGSVRVGSPPQWNTAVITPTGTRTSIQRILSPHLFCGRPRQRHVRGNGGGGGGGGA